MPKETRRSLALALCLLLAFGLWTAAVQSIDVQAVGPQGSSVGFAALNQAVHALTGVHMTLYIITDWLGLIPICIAMAFALLGLAQWIRRRSLLKVDFSLFVLGGFYITVIAVYVLFEIVVINRRPVLIDGYLEASYPSSTTMLVLCVVPTAMMQLRGRIRREGLRRCVTLGMTVYAAFMVVGRLVSGVHWFSDIIGGALVSAGLVMLYHGIVRLKAR